MQKTLTKKTSIQMRNLSVKSESSSPYSKNQLINRNFLIDFNLFIVYNKVITILGTPREKPEVLPFCCFCTCMLTHVLALPFVCICIIHATVSDFIPVPTWVGGPSRIDQLGKYGENGVWFPGARQTRGGLDRQGNIWMVGGLGYGISSCNFRKSTLTCADRYLNEVWKFNGTWNLVLVPFADENEPIPRMDHGVWIDSQNNIWIFGGESETDNLRNDLWKFDGQHWNWITGSNQSLGNYSMQGVSSPTNFPSSRAEFASAIDSQNNLFLFGGIVPPIQTTFNDLWKFDGNFWTWISGGENASDFNYGNKGVPNEKNLPRARGGLGGCMDSLDRFWIFGGKIFNLGFLNDLWMFNG